MAFQLMFSDVELVLYPNGFRFGDELGTIVRTIGKEQPLSLKPVNLNLKHSIFNYLEPFMVILA